MSICGERSKSGTKNWQGCSLTQTVQLPIMLSEMISYSAIDTVLGEVFLKGIPVTYCLANFRERNDQQYVVNE